MILRPLNHEIALSTTVGNTVYNSELVYVSSPKIQGTITITDENDVIKSSLLLLSLSYVVIEKLATDKLLADQEEILYAVPIKGIR